MCQIILLTIQDLNDCTSQFNTIRFVVVVVVTLITLALVFHMSQRFIDTYAMMLVKFSCTYSAGI
jgi:hypothetical protein